MTTKDTIHINDYTTKGEYYTRRLYLAGADAMPKKTLNRHGLIAGATGTGKTKTIQVLCEQLSLESQL
jgi:Cdc6-like AAA superfamily ATPase